MSLVTLFMTVGNTLMSVPSFRTFPADDEMLNREKFGSALAVVKECFCGVNIE